MVQDIKMNNTSEMYIAIRQLRPDISARDALSIARLPFARARELYHRGIFSRANVRVALRSLRFLNETR